MSFARPPGRAGQAADAVSAYTQVKMEDAPALLKLRESVCPDIWVEDPVVLLDRNLCGHPLAGLVWEGHIEKRSCWNLDGKKYRSGNAHVCVESRVYSYPFTWMTKNCWKSQLVDLGRTDIMSLPRVLGMHST